LCLITGFIGRDMVLVGKVHENARAQWAEASLSRSPTHPNALHLLCIPTPSQNKDLSHVRFQGESKLSDYDER
jgi:hypothetical protein